MSYDDPFYNPNKDADRTVVLKPNPGGHRANPPPNQAPPVANTDVPPPGYVPSPPTQQQEYRTPQPASGYPHAASFQNVPNNPTGPNALTDAAAKLLALIGRLKLTPHHNNVAALHQQVSQEIQNFEMQARNRGASQEAIIAARYALCASIDEAVLNTPWGSNSMWSSQSMLQTFHQEAVGGEKFFQIIERVKLEPATNIDLLELMSICIALGFEGKFRLMSNGRTHLENLRDELYRTIRAYRGDYERELSPHWRGLYTKTSRLRQVPLWVVIALSGALMLAIYAGFNVMLHQSTSPIINQFEEISPAVTLPEE